MNIVVGPLADFTRGRTSTPTGLSAWLLEDGRFMFYGRINKILIFSHKKTFLGANNLNYSVKNNIEIMMVQTRNATFLVQFTGAIATRNSGCVATACSFKNTVRWP